MTHLYTQQHVVSLLAKLVEDAGSIGAFAAQHDVCAESVRLMLKGDRPPTGHVLEVCGFKKAVRYEIIDAV